MDNEAKMILDDTISFCKRDGQDIRLINMLGQSNPMSLDEDSLTIEAPTKFAYSYLMKQREVIERYLEEIAFAPLSLIIMVPAPLDGSDVSRETPYAFDAARTVGAPREANAAPVLAAHAVHCAPERMTNVPALDLSGTSSNGASGVNVTNTVSPQQLKALRQSIDNPGKPLAQASMNQNRMPDAHDRAAEHESKSVSSKFTFENFVYGDENKLAYNSAVRFAAMAEEPGSYNPLFIYGNSGLGKTHLLLAIKNYLNENKPYLRVKYANSQAYIDDYISELRLQKTENRAIMRDYHNADILIIDDIQNIIGKTASVEYFFQLMDEFIRSGKKIAIASDRPPKKLGMDERMTSRFNSGSLCLVSEPSFEMKLEILKLYYEHTVLAEDDEDGRDEGDSLLTSIRGSMGKLSDEQLSHMAQVSGTNIRELESFCERCAGESYEREQEGKSLTVDDIDRIANEYFDSARKKIHIDTVQKVVEDFYHVSHEDLIGPKRKADIVFARHVAVYLALEMCEMTTTMVAAEFGGRDHSTAINSIKVIEKKLKTDRSLVEELQQLREKIRMKS